MAMKEITFDMLLEVFASEEDPQATAQACWHAMRTEEARNKVFEEAGIDITYKEQQAIGQNWKYAVAVYGNTYPLRAALKAAGYRFGALRGKNVWYRPMTTWGTSPADHMDVARAEMVGILGKAITDDYEIVNK